MRELDTLKVHKAFGEDAAKKLAMEKKRVEDDLIDRKKHIEDELAERKRNLAEMKELYSTVNERYNKLLSEKSDYKNEIISKLSESIKNI